MKFAHLADLHLGYRQYGLHERALDFNRALTRIVDIVLKKDFSFVLISGDIFHSRLPPAMAVRRLFDECSRLRDSAIPVVVIRGNHDASLADRGGNYLHLLADRSIATYLEGEDCKVDLKVNDSRVRIVGVGCFPETQVKNAFEKARDSIDPSADHNIFMFHQTLDRLPAKDESWPFYSAYFYEDIFRHVDYYALGHIHNHNLKHPSLPAYYPGSIESWDLEDAEKHVFDMESGASHVQPQNEKGFLSVELGKGPLRVESITIPTRKMFNLIFKYRETDPKYSTDEISKFLPQFNQEGNIINIKVQGYLEKGCRRSDLDSNLFRRLLDKPLKTRVVNDLRYPVVLKETRPSGRVTPEKAIETYYSESASNEKEAISLSSLTIKLFNLLNRNEMTKAKEELESAT